MLKHALAALLSLAAFFAITLLGSPLMLRSGIPFLTMLAFVAPCLWVLASVLLYVAWADSGWREEWERPVTLASTCNPQGYAFGLPWTRTRKNHLHLKLWMKDAQL